MANVNPFEIYELHVRVIEARNLKNQNVSSYSLILFMFLTNLRAFASVRTSSRTLMRRR
jgi:hypothetical protein